MRQLCFLLILLAGGCSSGEAPSPELTVDESLSVAERSTVQSARIFFGHQSVGRDLLAGIAEVAPELRVVATDEPGNIEGPAFIEASIGSNGDPRSKDRAFLEVVAKLNPGDVALYKYCFADMRAESDPDSLFSRYQHTLDLAARSGVRAVAVTMPVTTVAPAWKRWIKQALGKTTDAELNAKRQRFNELLRGAHTARPLIDLARWEATLEDGSSRTVSYAGRPLELLASEYTDDGSHLNARGRRHVASQFVRALSRAIGD